MSQRFSGVLTWLIGHAPLVLVVAAGGGLALWGQANEWKAPKFAALWSAEKEAKKKEDKNDKTPEADAKDWCDKHDVPDSQCTTCHPDIAVKGTAPPDDGPRVGLDPDAKPDTDATLCATHLMRVAFASAEAAVQAGVRVAAVEERPMTQYVRAVGSIDYEPNRLARLSTRAPGALWHMYKALGDEVREGELLALVDAAEVGKAKAEYLQAAALVDLKTKTYERLKQTPAAVPERLLIDAESAVREATIRSYNAQQALVNLGLPLDAKEFSNLSDAQLVNKLQFLGIREAKDLGLDPKTSPATLLPLRSPFKGVVAARNAVRGEVVDAARVLFTVADTRKMLVLLDLKPEAGRLVKEGQDVTFRPDGADAAVTGKVHWISTEVDEKTRAVPASAAVENPDGQLRAHAFGSGSVLIRRTPKAVVVPIDAVQWEGCHHIVFVRLDDKTFQARKVRLGLKNEFFTEILVGVLPGEVVATRGSHMLKSEILKSKIGADD